MTLFFEVGRDFGWTLAYYLLTGRLHFYLRSLCSFSRLKSPAIGQSRSFISGRLSICQFSISVRHPSPLKPSGLQVSTTFSLTRNQIPVCLLRPTNAVVQLLVVDMKILVPCITVRHFSPLTGPPPIVRIGNRHGCRSTIHL